MREICDRLGLEIWRAMGFEPIVDSNGRLTKMIVRAWADLDMYFLYSSTIRDQKWGRALHRGNGRGRAGGVETCDQLDHHGSDRHGERIRWITRALDVLSLVCDDEQRATDDDCRATDLD
jgi:hypothetical protein